MSKQEAVRIGNVLVIAKQDELALDKRSVDLLSKGYQISKTSHFVICQQPGSDQIILLHTFNQETINADLICFIEDQLASAGLVTSTRAFGVVLFGILASTFPGPRNQLAIWRQFCINTLNRLRSQIMQPSLDLSDISYIAPFATIYRRIAELHIGQSLLDVGSSFGFFPILMFELLSITCIVACDNNPDILTLATDLASVTDTPNITFMLKDLLATDFGNMGHCDTVTAIHLLEHLSEDEMPQAFDHLLRVTRRRLIISVPYEEQATLAYGHQQVFTREKLETWGKWCVEYLQERGHFWCEDVMGGLLVVERQ